MWTHETIIRHYLNSCTGHAKTSSVHDFIGVTHKSFVFKNMTTHKCTWTLDRSFSGFEHSKSIFFQTTKEIEKFPKEETEKHVNQGIEIIIYRLELYQLYLKLYLKGCEHFFIEVNAAIWIFLHFKTCYCI